MSETLALAIPTTAGRCPVCNAPADIGSATKLLPCEHTAFRTRRGVVIGWVNTGVMTVNLDAMVERRAAVAALALPPGERMAARAEKWAADVESARAAEPERVADPLIQHSPVAIGADKVGQIET